MFHQSGGCCDGSSPMCFEKGEFIVGSSDVWLGDIAGCDFFMAKDQFEFWQHTELTIDVVPGRGASFSLRYRLECVCNKIAGLHLRRFAKPDRNAFGDAEEGSRVISSLSITPLLTSEFCIELYAKQNNSLRKTYLNDLPQSGHAVS